MAAAKKPDKAEDKKKVMDVSNPGKAAPSATSRPVIASHRPMMADPMVASSSPEAPTAPTLAGKGKTIQPLAGAKPADTASKSAAIEVKGDTEKTAETETPSVKETASPTPPDPAPGKGKKPDSDEAKKAEASASTESETKKKTSVTTTTPPAQDDDVKQDSASKDEADGGPPSKAMEEKRKAEAEAAAKAEREKYQKMIDEKTYFAPIDQHVSSSAGGKVFMVLLFVVLLGLVAAVLLIDAGMIETNIELPIDLIQNE